MKRFILYISLLLFPTSLIFNNCSRQDDFPILKGPYLGQKSPGLLPEVFAPGIISTSKLNERDVSFSADGKEFYFTQWPRDGDWNVMCMRQENGQWSEPRKAPFSGNYHEAEAFFTPDEQKMFFISNRPKQGNGNPENWEIWFVEREGKEWGTPRILGSPFKGGFYTTFTKDWVMYYTAINAENADLYLSKYIKGKFGEPERLANNVNTEKDEYNSFIAPHESYLIFTSDGWGDSYGEGDLYICFRQQDGTWTRARNMGPAINSFARDYCPSVSPDGKYFFFSSRRSGNEDIYWVDARIIDKLKANKESIPSESRGVIAFSVTPADDNNEIYTVNADGSGLQQLTDHQGRDCAPAWSPDAAKIAFYVHYDKTHTWSIFVMDADGRNIKRLTDKKGVRDHNPSWSPDGKHIVFGRETSLSSEIWRMNSDGSDLRKYVSVVGGGPKWSPDGTRIAFHSSRDGKAEIYVMNTDGSNQRRLTNNEADDWWPSWSPDGTQIVFQSDRDGNYEIYKMNADGTNPIRLTINPTEDAEPSWSPDAEKIAFSSFRDGKFEIYVMNADGSSQTRLTHLAGQAIQPSWRPFKNNN